MEFKGTKTGFKIITGTTEGTPQSLPNNSVFAGSTKIAIIYGHNVEQATSNALLFSKSKELLEMLSSLSWAIDCENREGIKDLNSKAKKLIKEATDL